MSQIEGGVGTQSVHEFLLVKETTAMFQSFTAGDLLIELQISDGKIQIEYQKIL